MRRLRHRLLIALSGFTLTSTACGGPNAQVREDETELAADGPRVEETAGEDGASMKGERDDDAARRRFFDSDYTYCDADVLSHYWGVGIRESKAKIGHAIDESDLETLDVHIEQARDKAFEDERYCDLYSAGFTYDDADLLAYYWNVEVMEAKHLMDKKITRGLSGTLRDVIAEAESMRDNMMDTRTGFPDDYDPEQAEADAMRVERYRASEYTYCDAWLVAKAFDQGVYEGKVRIGQKLMSEWEDQIVQDLESGRQLATVHGESCEANWDFSDADIETMAAAWQMSVPEAVTAIENKLFHGNREALRIALGE